MTCVQGQVESLMQEVADEHSLDLHVELPSQGTGPIGAASATQEQVRLMQPCHCTVVTVPSCLCVQGLLSIDLLFHFDCLVLGLVWWYLLHILNR